MDEGTIAAIVSRAERTVAEMTAPDEYAQLRAENERLKEQIVGHCNRIAAQSLIITKAAEKPLTWTPTPPTEPGWYWLKDGHGDPVVVVVSVWDGVVWLESPGQSHSGPMDGYPNARWAGPLAPPPA